jgi:hypothetical protein
MGRKTLSQAHSVPLKFTTPNQLGFISPRTAAILAVLGLMLVVPLWWSKNKGDSVKAKPTGKPAPVAQASIADSPKAGTPGTINPDRFGLSFGHLSAPTAPSLTLDIMHSACNGSPQDMANPDKGQCNPIQGDSSCRSALPVLCVLPDGSTAESVGLVDTKVEGGSPSTSVSTGWVGGTLGATAPVAGFVLESLAAANARCTKELGTGWRIAELHDGKSGADNPSLLGKRGPGLTSQQTRHWVYANDQKANCWDASPP